MMAYTDLPIEKTALPARLRTCLRRAGYHNAAELIDATQDPATLQAIPGVGKTWVKVITTWVHRLQSLESATRQRSLNRGRNDESQPDVPGPGTDQQQVQVVDTPVFRVKENTVMKHPASIGPLMGSLKLLANCMPFLPQGFSDVVAEHIRGTVELFPGWAYRPAPNNGQRLEIVNRDALDPPA